VSGRKQQQRWVLGLLTSPDLRSCTPTCRLKSRAICSAPDDDFAGRRGARERVGCRHQGIRKRTSAKPLLGTHGLAFGVARFVLGPMRLIDRDVVIVSAVAIEQG